MPTTGSWRPSCCVRRTSATPTRAADAAQLCELADEGLELGIVSSAVPAIARAISSLLSRSLEDAKDQTAGTCRAAVVERVQLEIISPYGVAEHLGRTGHRFVLSRRDRAPTSEILATILVGRQQGHGVLLHRPLQQPAPLDHRRDVDFDAAGWRRPRRRVVRSGSRSPSRRFKPKAYHHIANFVVAKEHRGEGLARFLLDAILSTVRQRLHRRAPARRRALAAPAVRSRFLADR